MTFAKNQIVRGVVTGRFVVVSAKIREADNCEVVTVKQISPEGLVSKSTMRFPADSLVAE